MESYLSSTERFTTHILAADRAEAEGHAARRGMGETVVGQVGVPVKRPVYLHERFSEVAGTDYRHNLKLVHEVVFLLQLGVAAGVLSREQAYGYDRGLMHEAVHVALHRNEFPSTMHHLLESFRRVENSIPGYTPTYGA